jgi:glycosyltransferase involved in cell wall biosynthesis
MTVAMALDRVRESPRLTLALRDAELLAFEAARSTEPHADARRLRDAIEDADGVTSIAALHALGAVTDPLADEVLVAVLAGGNEPLCGHAAWVLAARRPDERAIPILADIASAGGFAGMLAERTLIEWARMAPGAVVAPVVLGHRGPAVDRSHLRGERLRRGRFGVPASDAGLVVVQPFLHARLDESGSSLGAGDAGGIASLLRSLGTSLSTLPNVDEVITITRAIPCEVGTADATSVHIADRHRLERIPYGLGPTVPWREAWQYRAHLEHEMTAIGRALDERRVVWHLRMADVGTLAAAAVARRLGQPVVFTAAPDPHVVIDALESDGRLDRANFSAEDNEHQYWFRARMVERLSAQVDHLALLPRPSLQRELVDLVGLETDDLERRSDVVPEGVDVKSIDAAIQRFAVPSAVADASVFVGDILDRLPPQRRSLPWIVTVGRLNSMKGPHRIVAAVAARPELAERFNVVMVGGDLVAPSPDERRSLDEIERASSTLAEGVVTVLGHRPPADICDLLVHAAENDAIYVCASDKEEFGLAIVEALAAGLVVVAPQRGGPRTYVDHGRNGLLCDTSSVEALAAAIEQADGMRTDRARLDASRAHVRAEMSVDAMAAQLAGIYAMLAPARSRAA